MAHFAKIENDLVTLVIVAEQDFVNGLDGEWVQTSYNTHGGQHTQGGTPLRGNFAGIGYTYDRTNDVFYCPSPFASWVLSTTTWTWGAPVAMPDDAGTGTPPKRYAWDETNTQWVAIEEE
jgi:hypothetical protein